MHYHDRYRLGEKTKPFCFILGAGASVQSGIPAASELVEKWLRDLHEASGTKKPFLDWAVAETLGIPDFAYEKRAEYYSPIYDLRFREREEDGALYLEQRIDDKTPSYGYAVLAHLMSGLSKVVITTNFDNLASDAIFQFGGRAPFVCGHENMASFIASKKGRPIIIKLHRDILTEPINSQKGSDNLAESLRNPLTEILKYHIPVFIGYGGNDGSLMTFLKSLGDAIPDRVYWCQYTHEPINERVADYLRHKSRWLVSIDGFDELMKSLEDKLGLSDLTEALKMVNEKRLGHLRNSLQLLTRSLDDALRDNLSEEGDDSIDNLRMRSGLADALRDQNRFIEAEAELRVLVALADKLLSPENPETLDYRDQLGTAIYRQGKYVEAEQEYRTTLAIRERVLGPKDSNTLKSRNNLANALRAQGKYAEAEQQHRATLAIRERVLGPEHPDTLTSRNNLATVLATQDRYAEAEEQFRATLPICIRVLGPEHPDTLRTRINLANTLQSQGKYAEAEEQHRANLAIIGLVIGPEHPDTLTSRNNLANTLQNQGKYAEAEEQHRAILPILERVLGSEHPDVFLSCYNLAGCLDSQDKTGEALVLARRALVGWTKVLGENHPYTKNAQNFVTGFESR